MEERILKKAAIFTLLLAIVICSTISFFPEMEPKLKEWAASAKEDQIQMEEELRRKLSTRELLLYYNGQTEKEAEELINAGKLRLKLPFGVSGSDLEVTEDYITQTISVKIPYAGEDYLYEYPMIGKTDHIESLTYHYQKNYGILEIVTNRVFEYTADFDKSYFYIDFLTPQEVYDKVVVIDAGHGGDDLGTVKQGIHEKDVNLDILLKLKEIFDAAEETDLGIYYTRTTDESLTEERRTAFAENTGADLFVSIHNHATPSGRMSNINGTQVIYDETNEAGARFAQICLEEVIAQTGSSNKGIMAGSNTKMMQNNVMPTVMIEVGFMTNETELALLCSQDYQTKAAQGIYNAILRAFSEGY